MNELLEKYWEGTATIQEEDRLKDYFSSGNVAVEHEVYTPLFITLDEEVTDQQMDFDPFAKVTAVQQEKKEEKRRWKGIAIAAGFALLMAAGAGSYQVTQDKNLGTYDNPEEAYAATMDALQLISTKFNQGRENLAPAAQVNKKTTLIFNIENK